MALVRRVKSFSANKVKSNDDSNTPRYRGKKKPLNREKSLSMDEFVPLHIDIQRNNLFQRQRNKIENESKSVSVEDFTQPPRSSFRKTPSKNKSVKIMEKRKSYSLDENCFAQFVSGNPYSVELRQVPDPDRFKKSRSRYNTVDVTRDLINDCADASRDDVNNINKPGNFPIEEDIEVRHYQRSIKSERPRTYTPPVTKRDEILEFQSPCRLEIDKDKHFRIKKTDRLRLINGYLQILDENNKQIFMSEVTLRKGTKPINKKELEMTDASNTIYRFEFDTTKDVKSFTEIEKSRLSSVKEKSVGPFFVTQLLRLLKRRSSRDLLESKGIIKNEAIFGNTLEALCSDSQPIPEVVKRIVELIERPENIKSIGIYRASANLAVVQNIRFEINSGKWKILENYQKEVDVLTGTLKLFFRELKEPLIPYEIYQELLANTRKPPNEQNNIDAIVDKLPGPNRATLLYLIKHLLKVCTHKESNKMDLHNIAICWGPSLNAFPDNCADIVTQTNEFTKITEYLLEHYKTFEDTIDNEIKKVDFVYDVVRKVTEVIESNLDVEGIYRKSGSNTKIDKITQLLNTQQLNELEKYDIHDLCCALKKYLSTLEEPLIPSDTFNHFCEDCDKLDDNVLKEKVQKIVENLPKKEVFLLLLEHLRKVIEHEKKNKMSFAVLTEIWMTTLTRPDVQQPYKKKTQVFSKLLKILINLNEKMLPDLLTEARIRESTYDNLLDTDDISWDKTVTKL